MVKLIRNNVLIRVSEEDVGKYKKQGFEEAGKKKEEKDYSKEYDKVKKQLEIKDAKILKLEAKIKELETKK